MSINQNKPKTPFTFLHEASVTREKRNKLNGHKSIIIWLTGLSGSGKSTLAHSLEDKLHNLGCRTYVLDGDNVRHGLSSNLTFSNKDRKENIRRIGEAAKLMMDAGVITITAFISPFIEDRNNARKLFSQGEFFEIFCDASLKICESRDVKGLYKLARDGKIKNYTGIDSPYEVPVNPELVINTESDSIEESTKKILNFLIDKQIIKN